MTTIKRSLTTLMLISLISSAAITHANQSREEKIQALKQQNYQKEEEIKMESEQFIADLRKKHPQFSDEHFESIQLMFEESLLKDSDYTPKRENTKKTESKPVSTSKKVLSKQELEGEVSQLVSENTDKEKNHVDKELIKEADITVISLTVKQGDTLGDIARRTYGDASMYIAIYEENKDQLNSPNKIPEGITLRVPKIDNSMQRKFAKLLKETQQNKAKKSETQEPQVKTVAKETPDSNSVSIKRSPEELNRLISEAVSKSTSE